MEKMNILPSSYRLKYEQTNLSVKLSKPPDDYLRTKIVEIKKNSKLDYHLDSEK